MKKKTPTANGDRGLELLAGDFQSLRTHPLKVTLPMRVRA
jgi:hypothetical protein